MGVQFLDMYLVDPNCWSRSRCVFFDLNGKMIEKWLSSNVPLLCLSLLAHKFQFEVVVKPPLW